MFSEKPENTLSGRVIAWHGPQKAWHAPATTCGTARGTALKPLKNRAKRVAASARLAKRQFCQSNQRLALIAASLRYVWTFYEDRRSEPPFSGPNFSRKSGLLPASETALSASKRLGTTATLKPILALTAALLAPTAPLAGDWSDSGSFNLQETAVIRDAEPQPDRSGNSAWSFADRESDWVALDAFERSRPGKTPPTLSTFRLPSGSSVEQLFALIAFAEAPKGRYDAIHYGAKVRPSKKPSQLTLAEIYRWIDQTPGQPHAIGNFQIIPSTLLNLQKRLGLPDSTLFSPATQNRMAALLLADAGHQKFVEGKISRATYQNNLAKIWAGLPLASGKSAYHGYAGNRATITRAFYDEKMAQIFGGSQTRLAKSDGAGQTAPLTSGWRRLGE